MKIIQKLKSAGASLAGAFSKVKEMKIFQKVKGINKWVKLAVILILIIAIVLLTLFGVKYFKSKKTSGITTAGTSIVMQGSVIHTISGSGTVEPIEQREIVPLVNGKIIEAPFNEGDSVKADDVLYKFEMTSAENAIKTAENSVQKAQTTLSNRQSNIEKVEENIKNLTVRATASGKISGLSLNVGEEASGKLCTITNYKEQTATVPFSALQTESIKIGDKATVAIDKYMINVEGKVIRKYSAPETLSSGAVTYNIEILLDDKYVVEENVKVSATVHSADGDMNCASYGSVKYADPVTVNAEQRGKISKIYVKNGDWIDKGEIIAVLSNSDLTDELKSARQNFTDAQMNLSEAMSSLEDRHEDAQDYILTSPINGTVLEKKYTVGDTVGGQNATTMMVVADMSKMKFTISVDELDISKIQLGQSVSVTADALENQRLTGEITSVSKMGTASNGVTTYPIEVTINEPGDLMPGMNVSAQITVERADNCLYLPVSAVEYFGGKYYVTVVGEVENMPQRGGNYERTQNAKGNNSLPNEKSGEQSDKKMTRQKEESKPDNVTEEKTTQRKPTEMKIKLSGKEERIEVEVGISNDQYYEIKSGVNYGQVVKNTSQSTGSSSFGFGGGMMPGGMMSGGMGSRMPTSMGRGMSGSMGGRR